MNPLVTLHCGLATIGVHPIPATGTGHHPPPLPHTLELSAAGLPALTFVWAPKAATVKAPARAHRAGASVMQRICAASHRRSLEQSVAAATNTCGLARAFTDGDTDTDTVPRTVGRGVAEAVNEDVVEKLAERCSALGVGNNEPAARRVSEGGTVKLGDRRKRGLGLMALDAVTTPTLRVAAAEGLNAVDAVDTPLADGVFDATGDADAEELGLAEPVADAEGVSDTLRRADGVAVGLGERDGRTETT